MKRERYRVCIHVKPVFLTEFLRVCIPTYACLAVVICHSEKDLSCKKLLGIYIIQEILIVFFLLFLFYPPTTLSSAVRMCCSRCEREMDWTCWRHLLSQGPASISPDLTEPTRFMWPWLTDTTKQFYSCWGGRPVSSNGEVYVPLELTTSINFVWLLSEPLCCFPHAICVYEFVK